MSVSSFCFVCDSAAASPKGRGMRTAEMFLAPPLGELARSA